MDGLDELVLIRWAKRPGQKHREKLNVIGSLVEDGIGYSFTYDAVPEITVTLHDPLWVLVTHPFFDRNQDDRLDAIDTLLDGTWWRLAGVAPDGNRLTLKFEPRDIQRLRYKFGHVTVSRNKMTRAQFERRLVKSVTDGSIGYYSRELYDVQPIAKGQSASTDNADSKDPGIDVGADIKVKGQKADSQQKRNIGIALKQASDDGAGAKATKALLVAGIGESDFRESAVDGVTGTHKGVWQSNQIPPDQVATQAHHFLVGGRSFRAGGAIQAAKDHPEWSAGKIASYTEISDADGSFYDAYSSEADAILESAGGSLPTSVDVPVSYQFSVAKDEDYWTALVRLASEVNWRMFWHRGVIYSMDDFQLLRGTPQWRAMCISDPNIIGLPSFEWDPRGSFPHEMEMDVLMPRNFLAPGDVVNVDEAGPGNGRWIVAEISGSWFQPKLHLKLRLPQAPKKEPAHDERSTDIGTGDDQLSGDGSAAIQKWIEISQQNMPYVWGGGHNSSFAPTSGGYDCSGYIGAGLHAAGLIDRPMTSGEMASIGKPGRGKEFTIWANGHHVFVIFENGAGGKYRRADTSPQGGETQRGPHVRENTRSTAGFTPRHFEGH